MVLSRREKYIAIGVVISLILLGVYELGVSPYLQARDDIAAGVTKAQKTLDDNRVVLHQYDKLVKDRVWNVMLASGLGADYSTAQSQTQRDLQGWARAAGVSINAISSDRAPTAKSVFQVIDFNIDFNVSGQDSMKQIAHFLWSMESAAIPIRVNDLKVQAVREGTDDLNVKLIVSALYMPPVAGGSRGSSGTVSAGEAMQ